jgi:GntR family transcriptional regulator
MSRVIPLILQVSPGDSRPISKQITDGIRRLIASGELPLGAQLPSVRGLAQQLTINPNTVAKAYSELANEGWLDARQGLGLFVAEPRQRLSDSERERRLALAVEAFTADIIGLDFPLKVVLQRVSASLGPCLKKHSA